MTDQKATVKSFALAGKSATEAFKFVQVAYGELALSRGYVFRLHKQFAEGRESIDDDRGKCPKPTLRTEKNCKLVDAIIKEDRRITVREIADRSGLSVGTVHTILHVDLNLSKKAARWVPRLLNDELKKQRIAMARDFKNRFFMEGEAFFDKLVTVDEAWVLYSTPELKRHSAQWLPKGTNPPRKAKVAGSRKKVMLIAFFDVKGMVYHHYVTEKATVNSTYYCGVLQTFLRHLQKKRPEKVTNGWLLHQDNARPHVSAQTKEFMTKKCIETFGHAPYSPDLAPCDFFLFPQLKNHLSGKSFDTLTEVKVAVEGFTTQVFRNGAHHVFEQWQRRMNKCLEVKGDYVEK